MASRDRITLRLPAKLTRLVKRAAKAHDLSLNEHIRQVLASTHAGLYSKEAK